MATVTKGKTFISGETVEPADMHQLVDSATVTNIVDADISASAAIAASKLAATLDLSSKTVTLPDSNIVTAKIADSAVTTAKIADSAVTTAKIADSAVTTAKINNAAVTAAKLDGAQTGSAPIYGCRAWVRFVGNAGSTVDGEFRCTITESGNVTKVVRSGTGDFTAHLTTALASASPCVLVTAINGQATIQSSTNSQISIGVNTGGNTPINSTLVCVAVFA